MAALTPDAQRSEKVFATEFLGLAHRRFAFVTQTVNNADTFETGSHIVFVAWEAFGPAQSCAATVNGGAGTSEVIFNTSGSNRQGYCHVWSRG